MSLHVLGRGFFRASADFADHHNRLGHRIPIEQVDRVHEISADDRIAANADRCRLPNATSGELINRFISKRAGARNEAYGARCEYLVRDDTNLTVTRCAHAWAVWANQTCSVFVYYEHGTCHVNNGDTLGNAYNELDTGACGFHNGVGSASRGYEDTACGGSCGVYGFFNGVKNG